MAPGSTGRFTNSAGGIALLAALLVPAVGHAEAAGQWHGPDEMFAKICAFCHLTGVGPELRGRGLGPRFIVEVARGGLRAMPAFRPTEFSDAELDALAAMISRSAAPPPATPCRAARGKAAGTARCP
jgi:mono/diheme cytochrome c family protein